jgi:F0F1-type ATP synthase beta subunit
MIRPFCDELACGSLLAMLSLDPTRTLRRGAAVRSAGLPLEVPVGRALFGRVVTCAVSRSMAKGRSSPRR